MQRKLTIALDSDVYERLCRAAGGDDEKRCAEFVLELVKNRVCSPYTDADVGKPYRQSEEDSETVARAYLKMLYQSGDLDLARKSGDPPQWVELAYQAMAAGDDWDGSAVKILELGYREMAADEEREAEADEWAEGLIGDVLLQNEDTDESR